MRRRLAAYHAAALALCVASPAAAESPAAVAVAVTVTNTTDRPLRLYWFDTDRAEGPVPPGEARTATTTLRPGGTTHLEIAVADAPARPHDFADKCWVALSAAGAHAVRVGRTNGRLACNLMC